MILNSQQYQKIQGLCVDSLKTRVKELQDFLSANDELSQFDQLAASTLEKVDGSVFHHFFVVDSLEQYYEIENLLIELQEDDEVVEDIQSFWLAGRYSAKYFEYLKEFDDFDLAMIELFKRFQSDLTIIVESLIWEKAWPENFELIDLGVFQTDRLSRDSSVITSIKLVSQDKDNFDSHFEKMEKALKIIKESSPLCFEALECFSHTIIPINEPGIVSYSSQSIPGISCINFYERNFVDLIDDLVHENGHHHLNAYLNHTELIYEDDEKIFYSPWRRTERAIRGIYHAAGTFIWAYLLFKDLSKDLRLFDREQSEYINKRLNEERTMLLESKDQISRAKDLNKISKSGSILIEDLLQFVD